MSSDSNNKHSSFDNQLYTPAQKLNDNVLSSLSSDRYKEEDDLIYRPKPPPKLSASKP